MRTEQDRSRLVLIVACGLLAVAWGYPPQASAAEEPPKEAAVEEVPADSEEEEAEEEEIHPTHQELGTILVETEAEAGSLPKSDAQAIPNEKLFRLDALVVERNATVGEHPIDVG